MSVQVPGIGTHLRECGQYLLSSVPLSHLMLSPLPSHLYWQLSPPWVVWPWVTVMVEVLGATGRLVTVVVVHLVW